MVFGTWVRPFNYGIVYWYLQMALRANAPVHDATAGTAAVAEQRESVFHSR